VSLCFKT